MKVLLEVGDGPPSLPGPLEVPCPMGLTWNGVVSRAPRWGRKVRQTDLRARESGRGMVIPPFRLPSGGLVAAPGDRHTRKYWVAHASSPPVPLSRRAARASAMPEKVREG